MPSRPAVGLILLFWLGTTLYVGYREIWPRLFAGDPPPIRIDLADEAAQSLPTTWNVYRGDQKVGELITRMQYVPEDDTFRFVSSYRGLAFDFDSISLTLPKLETMVRVSRSGDLREQQMTGTLRGSLRTRLGNVGLGDEAAVQVTGVVVNGQLVGHCRIWYPSGAPAPTVDRPLEPVPVPAGQVLNPMMPVSRLQDVRPGKRWVIREVDPLRDAVTVLFKEVLKDSELAAEALPRQRSRELLAEVLSTPQPAERPRMEAVSCWVIEYRGEDVEARTWVAVEDGRVIRQEAAGFGERLRFDRQD